MASASEQKSDSSGQTQSQQTVWGGQSPYLQSLYQSAMNNLAGSANLPTQAAATLAPFMSGAIPALQQQLSGAINPFVDSQIQNQNALLGQQFNQAVLPGIQDQAVSSGGLGGARQGVAQGIASQALGQAMASNSSNLWSSAYGQALSAQSQALGLVPSLYNTAMQPSTQYTWYPYQQAAGIIGAPTVLGSSTGQQQSSGKGISASGGQAKP